MLIAQLLRDDQNENKWKMYGLPEVGSWLTAQGVLYNIDATVSQPRIFIADMDTSKISTNSTPSTPTTGGSTKKRFGGGSGGSPTRGSRASTVMQARVRRARTPPPRRSEPQRISWVD